MTRRFISAALGLALAASTTFGASAATNPTALVSALSGQAGVSQELLDLAAARMEEQTVRRGQLGQAGR